MHDFFQPNHWPLYWEKPPGTPEERKPCVTVPCPPFAEGDLAIEAWRQGWDEPAIWHWRDCNGECGEPEGCYTESS